MIKKLEINYSDSIWRKGIYSPTMTIVGKISKFNHFLHKIGWNRIYCSPNWRTTPHYIFNKEIDENN